MLVIVVVHRLYRWVGLLITFLPWQFAEYCWLLCELFLRNEASSLFLQVLCPRCIMVSSAITSYLQFLEATKGSDNSLYCFAYIRTSLTNSLKGDAILNIILMFALIKKTLVNKFLKSRELIIINTVVLNKILLFLEINLYK